MDDLSLNSINECANCGSHVSPAFARIYGDEQDRAQRCPECAESMGRLKRGSATGREPVSRGTVIR